MVMWRWALTASSCWIVVGASAPASAQDLSEAWRICENSVDGPAAAVLVSCTAIIEADQETPRNLAVAFTNRGNGYANQGDDVRALADYGHAIRLDGDYQEPYYNRSLIYLKRRDFARAIIDLDQVIRINPRLVSSYVNRGVARRAQHDYDGAFADYAEAIRLDPNHASTFYNRGTLYRDMGDYERAIADYDRAALLSPENADTQNNRCWTRALANRDLEVARAACDEALRLEPNSGDILDSRGFLGLRQGRWQQAWNDFDAAVRANESSAHYRYGRGVAALRLGRTADGRADIVYAEQLDPDIARTFAGYGITP